MVRTRTISGRARFVQLLPDLMKTSPSGRAHGAAVWTWSWGSHRRSPRWPSSGRSLGEARRRPRASFYCTRGQNASGQTPGLGVAQVVTRTPPPASRWLFRMPSAYAVAARVAARTASCCCCTSGASPVCLNRPWWKWSSQRRLFDRFGFEAVPEWCQNVMAHPDLDIVRRSSGGCPRSDWAWTEPPGDTHVHYANTPKAAARLASYAGSTARTQSSRSHMVLSSNCVRARPLRSEAQQRDLSAATPGCSHVYSTSRSAGRGCPDAAVGSPVGHPRRPVRGARRTFSRTLVRIGSAARSGHRSSAARTAVHVGQDIGVHRRSSSHDASNDVRRSHWHRDGMNLVFMPGSWGRGGLPPTAQISPPTSRSRIAALPYATRRRVNTVGFRTAPLRVDGTMGMQATNRVLCRSCATCIRNRTDAQRSRSRAEQPRIRPCTAWASLLSASRIEYSHGEFYYYEGMTPRVRRSRPSTQAKQTIEAALGVDVLSLLDTCAEDRYGPPAIPLLVGDRGVAALSSIKGPTEIDSRYLTKTSRSA